MLPIDNLQKEVKKHMTGKRYRHSVGVRYTAAALAMRYREDIVLASTAGILHDCAKCLSEEELLLECKKHNIACTKPYLLHAELGACYAREKYGIKQKEILLAIRYHTTGRPAMSPQEKILFTADYIEPGRKWIPNLTEIRQMAFINLEEAVYMILDNTLSHLKADVNKEIDEHSIEAHRYYQEKLKYLL